RRNDANPSAGPQRLLYRLRPAQCRQEKSRSRPEVAWLGRSCPPACRERRRPCREFSAGRHATVEAGLRLAATVQPETDLLFDLRIWTDRAVGRAAGLCTGYPCGLRLRYGPPLIPARTIPARLLRHLPCGCADGCLCLRGDLGGAIPASWQSKRPAHRRFDAGIDAQPDFE